MRTGSKYRPAALAVALVCSGLLFAACDSESGDDADPFVGSWAVTGVALNGDDYTSLIFGFGEIESIGATFSSNGAFEIVIVSAGGEFTTTGAYTLGDDRTITFASESFEQPLELTYDTSGSNTVVLTAVDATLLTELSGIDLSQLPFEVDSVGLTITREE